MICAFTLCKETNCGKFISVYQHYRMVIFITTAAPQTANRNKMKRNFLQPKFNGKVYNVGYKTTSTSGKHGIILAEYPLNKTKPTRCPAASLYSSPFSGYRYVCAIVARPVTAGNTESIEKQPIVLAQRLLLHSPHVTMQPSCTPSISSEDIPSGYRHVCATTTEPIGKRRATLTRPCAR